MSDDALFDGSTTTGDTDTGGAADTGGSPPATGDAPDPATAAAVDQTGSDRPDFLLEKYSSVEDQAKAYVELQKKFGEVTAPPESYDLTLPDGVTLPEGLLDKFKDLGYKQEQAQGFVDIYEQMILPDVVEARVELERQRLGEAWSLKGQELSDHYNLVKDQATRMLPDGPALVEKFQGTAGGMLHLENMVKAKVAESQLPDQLKNGKATSALNIHEVIKQRSLDPRSDRTSDKYDPGYVQETTRMALEAEAQV